MYAIASKGASQSTIELLLIVNAAGSEHIALNASFH